jgi:hypothetical protein
MSFPSQGRITVSIGMERIYPELFIIDPCTMREPLMAECPRTINILTIMKNKTMCYQNRQ